MEEFGPKVIADYENGGGAGLSVFGDESPAEEGRDAERFKGIGSDPATGKFLGAAAAGEAELVVDEAKHVIKGVVPLLENDEGRGGKAPRAELISGKNSGAREARCVFVGIRIEESAINDTENCRCGADAKSQSANGDQSESAIFAEIVESIAEVLEEGFEE
jgi:hypothetical protein